MIKFLHISDVHLNKTFATKNEMLRQRLQRVLMKSFQHSITYCIDHQVNALLIAGDLFDTNKLSLKDKEFVKDQFKKLGHHDINVYYASGNHDYTSFDSDIRKIDFPDNVYTFFDDEYKMYDLKDRETDKIYKIVGCGHMLEHETRNLIEKFPIGPYIGLAHSMVESRLTIGDEGQYLPSTIETIRSRGYLYFALGHVHSGGAIDKDETIYYAGVLQGLNRNEVGFKGGNLVTIDDDQMHVEQVILAELTYDEVTYDMTACDSIDNLFDQLMTVLEVYENKHSLSLTLSLEGRTPLFVLLKDQSELDNLTDMLLDRLDFFNLIIKSRVKSHFLSEHYKDKKSVLGAILNDVSELKSHPLPTLDYISKQADLNSQALLADMEDKIMAYFLEDNDEN